MIRFLIKLALFPVTLILTLLVAFARFFCLFSGMVLNVIAGALFLFGVLCCSSENGMAFSALRFWPGR